MKILKLLSFLKERRILRKLDLNMQQTRSSIINYHNTYIKKYPNLAVFAFDRVAADISIYGLYEREILEQLLGRLIFKNLKASETICLDIGANLGNHTLFFSKFFDKVLSFEPHPETFELLKFNTRKLKNVSIFQFGLSSKDDDMNIGSIQDTHYGVSSLRKEIDQTIKTDQNIFYNYDTKVKNFDNFYQSLNQKNNISFIKIDVEGHELFVLQGMKKTLSQYSPIICLEQDPDQFHYINNELSSKTINFLKDNNYIYFYTLSSSRDWKIFNNFFFVKKIIKLFEAVFFGIPEITWKISRINKFSKKTYRAIIASKTQLK